MPRCDVLLAARRRARDLRPGSCGHPIPIRKNRARLFAIQARQGSAGMTQLHPETRVEAGHAEAGHAASDRLAVEPAADLAADLAAVEDRLARFFSERVSAASAYDPSYRRLWEAARDAADGGKRIRPR